MRLIDADALLQNNGLAGMSKHGSTRRERLDTRMLYEIHDMIQNAPTIDAVPVVRCRDCKYKQAFTRENAVACYFYGKPLLMDDDGFCYCGEKED